jgi:glyoxylase-like metal-dependent hydrolase (beta-lactamase superfamily II)
MTEVKRRAKNGLRSLGRTGRLFALEGPVNIGLVEVGGGLVVVDTGLGEAAAGSVLKAAEELKLEILYIFNTHGHADHIGGNHHLLKQTRARVMAPYEEAPFLTNTYLEPVSLVGGAPYREISGKFLQARPARVDKLVKPGLLPGLRELEAVSLPGHSVGMVGLRCEDVLFSADAFFPPSLIDKHGLLYVYHPGRCLESLDRLLLEREALLVPSHGPLEGFDPGEVIEANRQHLMETREYLLNETAEGVDRETLTARLAGRLGLPDDHVSWALALGTVQGYLTTLREEGLISSTVAGGRLFWRRK